MAPSLREDADQLSAHLFGQKRQIFFLEGLHVRRGVNGWQKRLMIHRQQEESPPKRFVQRNFW